MRRGGELHGRRSAIVVAFATTALLAAGCGGGAKNGRAGSEREADAALINTALARELASVEVYGHGLALPGGMGSSLMGKFRAQDQEHADQLMKMIRGFGATVDSTKVRGERQSLDLPSLKHRVAVLALAYERESKGIGGILNEVAKLSTGGTRSLLISIATNQAEHLALLRQELGVATVSSVPEAFETGATPAPRRAAAGG